MKKFRVPLALSLHSKPSAVICVRRRKKGKFSVILPVYDPNLHYIDSITRVGRPVTDSLYLSWLM